MRLWWSCTYGVSSICHGAPWQLAIQLVNSHSCPDHQTGLQALRPKPAADDCYFGCCGKVLPTKPAVQTPPKPLPKVQTGSQATSQTAALATSKAAAGSATTGSSQPLAQTLPASQKLPAENLPASQTQATKQARPSAAVLQLNG